jgi:DNA-binding NarL/FixJ family response regulator
MKSEHRQLVDGLRPGRRVLVVDGHASFRTCARTLLESEGFEVVGEAADGVSAVAFAAGLGPEPVFLDIQVPDIAGFAGAEQLLAADPRPRIVLVSSRDRSYGPLIEKSGACGFRTKADLQGDALTRLLE